MFFVANRKKDLIEKKENKAKKETKEKQEKLNKVESKNEEKKNKIIKILDEVKAFFLILVIIGIIGFACFYWYKHIKVQEDVVEKEEKQEENRTDEIATYKATDQHKIYSINNKYIIEYEDNVLYKILDFYTNVLFEGEEEFTTVEEGIDSTIYIIKEDTLEEENHITVSKLHDKKIEAVKELNHLGVTYVPIRYQKNDIYQLIGFTGTSQTLDEELNEVNKSYVYTLANKELELKDLAFAGDKELNLEKQKEIISYDKRYIVLKDTNNKYGLYDINNGKMIITPQYEGLITDKTNYIAIKNGKYGVINSQLKKKIDFIYDFIDRKNGYYIVSKGAKMALMNKDYHLITKFDFLYQPSKNNIKYKAVFDNGTYNTFQSYQVGNKYVLITNYMEYKENLEYDLHETYIIASDGSYSTIKENEFYVDEENELIYSYNKEEKKYTFYDQDLKEKYTIDISNYDYNKRADVHLLNGNTIVIHLDSDVYFDYENGEYIDTVKDYTITIEDIKISYSSKEQIVTYLIDEKEITKIDVKEENDHNGYYNKLDDTSIYFMTDTDFVRISWR